MFGVISVYFNVRNILPKSGTFPPGHSVYINVCVCFLRAVKKERPIPVMARSKAWVSQPLAFLDYGFDSRGGVDICNL